MSDVQLLKYGFVVPVAGKATYDHYVRARLDYVDAHLKALASPKYPVIATRILIANEEGVRSPIFKYRHKNTALQSFQSAYYLADALMRKGILPVYIPSTGQVKDIMPLLNEVERQDAAVVIQILRKRYIKAEQRKPSKGFMVQQEQTTVADAYTVDLSESEILKIFGRLPQENVHKLNPEYDDIDFIGDGAARWA